MVRIYFEIDRAPSELLLPRMTELAWQLSRYLWRGSVNFKINSRPLFTIIFKLKNDNLKTRDFSPLIKRAITGVWYFIASLIAKSLPKNILGKYQKDDFALLYKSRIEAMTSFRLFWPPPPLIKVDFFGRSCKHSLWMSP